MSVLRTGPGYETAVDGLAARFECILRTARPREELAEVIALIAQVHESFMDQKVSDAFYRELADKLNP